MAKSSFKKLFAEARSRDSFWAAKAIQDFTDELYALMESQGVNKAELARRIGSSPAYVTKALRGNTNFTVDSMARLARAVGGKLCIHVGHEEAQTRWFDVVERKTEKAWHRDLPVISRREDLRLDDLQKPTEAADDARAAAA